MSKSAAGDGAQPVCGVCVLSHSLSVRVCVNVNVNVCVCVFVCLHSEATRILYLAGSGGKHAATSNDRGRGGNTL